MWSRAAFGARTSWGSAHGAAAVAAIVGALVQGGCIQFYSTDETRVRVIDAATAAPIGGAQVAVHHVRWMSLNAPDDVEVRTDPQGDASFRWAPRWSPYVGWLVIAAGYLPVDEPFSAGAAAEWPPRFVQIDEGGAWLIRMHRSPAPTLVVVVPNGYRGPLTIDLRPTAASVNADPLQRNFRVVASPDGHVRAGHLIPPSLPRRFLHPGLVIVQESGAIIPSGYRDYQPDLREARHAWSDRDQERLLLAIGTASDYFDAERLVLRVSVNSGGGRSLAEDDTLVGALFGAAD